MPRYDSSDSQESNVPQSHSLSVSLNRGKAVKQQAGVVGFFRFFNNSFFIEITLVVVEMDYVETWVRRLVQQAKRVGFVVLPEI